MNHALVTDKAKRLYVLDTNVLMHDPTALFRFQEHSIYLPMVVLEELDHSKKGMSDVARNVRQVSRFLDELLSSIDSDAIRDGIRISLRPDDIENDEATGKLYFQTELKDMELPDSLPGTSADNSILGTALALQKERDDTSVILVSKDINLRIKATVVGITAEDYFTDRVLEDVDLLYTGSELLDEDFWESNSKELESWQEEGRTFYKLAGPDTTDWVPNLLLYSEQTDNPFEAIVRETAEGHAVIETLTDHSNARHSVWGIMARNREQNFALNLLMDPEIDFVSLMGVAGTGKTLLTLAAALAQTLDDKIYNEIIMTRVTVPVGEDIGFLPGTEEEKMTPWMGALMDNLEVLTQTDSSGGDWGRAATNDLIQNRIKIRSLNFMRGRTFLNRFMIIDEAQNLTAKQMKTLITRAGPGTKVICLGNVSQIDTPYLTETTSGLTYVVDRFKTWEHSGHITLRRGERSRLAAYASDQL